MNTDSDTDSENRAFLRRMNRGLLVLEIIALMMLSDGYQNRFSFVSGSRRELLFTIGMIIVWICNFIPLVMTYGDGMVDRKAFISFMVCCISFSVHNVDIK